MNGIIYMYTSPSGKKYVGQTIREEKRKKQHERACLRNECSCFHNAIIKYGYENMKYEILHQNIKSIEELNILEKEEILKQNSISPYGYNQNSGGNNAIPCSAVREKMSKIMKGKKFPKMTDETKRKMSISRTGIKYPKEFGEKISKRQLGRKLPKEWIENSRKARMGMKHTEEHKRKIKESNKTKKTIKCVETNIVYESAVEAEKLTGTNQKGIRECCKGNNKTSNGFHWEYVK